MRWLNVRFPFSVDGDDKGKVRAVPKLGAPETLARVKTIALELDDFGLTGLAFGAALFGSAVLAIALQRGWVGGEAAFDLSRLDEAWQEEKWGVDAEAAERTERLRGESVMVDRWFGAARTPD